LSTAAAGRSRSAEGAELRRDYECGFVLPTYFVEKAKEGTGASRGPTPGSKALGRAVDASASEN